LRLFFRNRNKRSTLGVLQDCHGYNRQAKHDSRGKAKQQVESLLHKLPDNCSLEDIQYHLYVLDKVCGVEWMMLASRGRCRTKMQRSG
jgi:hypothetical protein